MIEEKRGCKFIRSNPEAADFKIHRVINQVYMLLKQSTVKSTKKSLIDDLSRELLEAAIEFKPKCKKEGSKLIRKIVKNVLPEYKKWLVNNMWKKGSTAYFVKRKEIIKKNYRSSISKQISNTKTIMHCL